jgi:aminoglycoside phosphotransferase (APT) family kinase protein
MYMTFSRDVLNRLIRRHLPNLPDPLFFEPIRTGKFNTSYWVQAGEEELVLRIAPPRNSVFLFYERDMMRQEPAIHALIRARTNVPVARIVAFDSSFDLIDRTYLIMERLPGWPLTEAAQVNMDRVLRRTGELLAQVHQLHEDRYGYLGAHRPMEPQSRWIDAFAIMWGKLVDDIVAAGYYDPEESTQMRSLLDRHLELFDRPVPASLLHMDIWYQNILVDSASTVTGIVDWDRALWGDPEIEFAVLDYCGISEPAFWEGYGKRRDWSAGARIRQVFYLLYELQKYIVIRHGRNHNPSSARDYKRQVVGIVKQLLR